MADWNAITDKTLGDPLFYQDVNDLIENTEYNKQQHEVDHDPSTGHHEDTIHLGDGTDSDKTIEAQTADGAGEKPRLRWDNADQVWKARQAGAGLVDAPIQGFKDWGNQSGDFTIDLGQGLYHRIAVIDTITMKDPSVLPRGVMFMIDVTGVAGTDSAHSIDFESKWIFDNEPDTIYPGRRIIFLAVVDVDDNIRCTLVDKVYGELYEDSSSFTVSPPGAGVWTDITGNGGQLSLGPTAGMQKSGNYSLLVEVGGNYRLTYHVSFSGGSGGDYIFGLSINGAAPAYKTQMRRTTGSSDTGGCGGLRAVPTPESPPTSASLTWTPAIY